MLGAVVLVTALALAIRLAPALFVPNGAGVDQWYWKSYIEALRRTRRMPVRMPQFLLDEGHWYPPFFPWLMAKLPSALFDRWAMQLAAFIDIVRMVVLLAATWLLCDSPAAALAAGIAYAVTPLLITYNMQLNPRGMGALFMDLMWLVVASITVASAPAALWLLALLLAGLVLVTHKMAMQVFWFTSIIGSGLALDVRLALLVPGSVIAALMLSGGFYLRTMRAHWDSVSFWLRNWSGNGVHPVLESPVYGEPGYESPGKFYRSGWRAWLRRLQFLIGFNPWMPAVLFIGVCAVVDGYAFSTVEVWGFAWLALTFLFSLLTTLVPAMRCLGQGYLYGYNGSFPASLVLGLTWPGLGGTWYWKGAALVTVVACVAALFVFFRTLRTSRTMKIDAHLDAAIQRLAELPQGTVMCLPQHWHDAVAYRAKQPVLFGGHGYGYHLLEPIFPVLRMRMPEIVSRYHVQYLLTYEGYLPTNFRADVPPAEIESFGDYRLYRFLPAPDGGAAVVA